MPEPDRPFLGSNVAAPNIVSYVLGELDAEQKETFEKQLAGSPLLQRELDDVREHMGLHHGVRKVAPRRGSFERLRRRMQREGALAGAVPGVHCMLRRAFMLSLITGLLIAVALATFARPERLPGMQTSNVLGQIIYFEETRELGGGRGREVSSGELRAGEDKNTGSYDATIWLPTGVENAYSTLDVAPNTLLHFSNGNELSLKRGYVRQFDIVPGAPSDGEFIVRTPHCTIQATGARLSIRVDDAETQVTVGSGSAKIRGRDVERTVHAGYCTSVVRDAEPGAPRPVLELVLDERAGGTPQVQATLRNVGFVPVRIRRAFSTDMIYLLSVARPPDFSEEGRADGFTYPPKAVYPKPGEGEPGDHRGDAWLKPGESYTFIFDVSPLLIARVEYWLTLSYQGGLYGPQGYAQVTVVSKPLKLDMRNR